MTGIMASRIVITSQELSRLKSIAQKGRRVMVLSITYRPSLEIVNVSRDQDNKAYRKS